MTSLEIGSRRIGPGEPCFLVAEIGINHNGDLKLAKQSIDAAVAGGADEYRDGEAMAGCEQSRRHAVLPLLLGVINAAVAHDFATGEDVFRHREIAEQGRRPPLRRS